MTNQEISKRVISPGSDNYNYRLSLNIRSGPPAIPVSLGGGISLRAQSPFPLLYHRLFHQNLLTSLPNIFTASHCMGTKNLFLQLSVILTSLALLGVFLLRNSPSF